MAGGVVADDSHWELGPLNAEEGGVVAKRRLPVLAGAQEDLDSADVIARESFDDPELLACPAEAPAEGERLLAEEVLDRGTARAETAVRESAEAESVLA